MKLLRKAQVGGLQGFILSIVTVAVVLAIGLIVISSLNTTTKEMYTSSRPNESVASGSSLSQSSLFVSASACRNLTSNVLTVNGASGLCNVSSSGVVTVDPANATGNVYVDYSHYTPTAAYNSTSSLITKLATVPTWISIIIIVALAFIVLSFFLGKRQ